MHSIDSASGRIAGLSIRWIVLLRVGHLALLRTSKNYFLKSVTAEGETWARDIGLLHDYLETHFPEIRVTFSHFRDVPPTLASNRGRGSRWNERTQRSIRGL